LNSGPKPLRGSALRVRATARTHPAEESMHEPVFGWVLTAAAKSVVRPSRRAPSTGPGPAAGPSGTRTACATPSVGSRTRSTRRGLPRQRRPQPQLQARPLRSDRVHRDDPPARAHARLRVGQLHRLTSRRTGDAQPRQCGGSRRLLSICKGAARVASSAWSRLLSPYVQCDSPPGSGARAPFATPSQEIERASPTGWAAEQVGGSHVPQALEQRQPTLECRKLPDDMSAA
jgi:hypothetical protein